MKKDRKMKIGQLTFSEDGKEVFPKKQSREDDVMWRNLFKDMLLQLVLKHSTLSNSYELVDDFADTACEYANEVMGVEMGNET